MVRLLTRAALALAMLAAAPANAFHSGARPPALRALAQEACTTRRPLQVLRMAEDGDHPGAAEQEAAIKAAMEAARMKAKTAGASSGQKRLGTVRLADEDFKSSAGIRSTINGKRLGTGICWQVCGQALVFASARPCLCHVAGDLLYVFALERHPRRTRCMRNDASLRHSLLWQ